MQQMVAREPWRGWGGHVLAAPTHVPGISAAMRVTASAPLSFISSQDLKRGRKEKKIMEKQIENFVNQKHHKPPGFQEQGNAGGGATRRCLHLRTLI